jgi:hypothetical protein
MAGEEKVLLTVILHHHQSETLDQIMRQKAWGVFHYEVYPAYDFRAIAAQLKKDHA